MPGETTARQQMLNKAVALVFLLAAMCAGYIKIGLPPVLIVGGSGVAAFALWQGSYLKRPSDPSVILPLFLLTVSALDVHMAEEYLTKFGPAMSRLFDISWTEQSFLLIFAFVGPALYALTAAGLYYRAVPNVTYVTRQIGNVDINPCRVQLIFRRAIGGGHQVCVQPPLYCRALRRERI
jgi:hypothetical protein